MTKEHVGAGMTMAEICRAAITLSDNTAGNLMLASFGGPPALTAYVRTLGDDFTRLDRIETDLNEARTGDPRDTTTPAAITENLRRIVLGDALSETSRRQIGGLAACQPDGRRASACGAAEGLAYRRQDRHWRQRCRQ